MLGNNYFCVHLCALDDFAIGNIMRASESLNGMVSLILSYMACFSVPGLR